MNKFFPCEVLAHNDTQVFAAVYCLQGMAVKLVIGLNNLSPVCADSNDHALLGMKLHCQVSSHLSNSDKSSWRKAES